MWQFAILGFSSPTNALYGNGGRLLSLCPGAQHRLVGVYFHGQAQAERLTFIISDRIFRIESESESEDREGPAEDFDVEDIVNSSRRPSRAGSEATRGEQAIQKKIDRGDPAYEGLEKSQEQAEEIIREVMESPNQEKSRYRDEGGEEVNIYDLNTGRGIKIKNGAFETFMNSSYGR